VRTSRLSVSRNGRRSHLAHRREEAAVGAVVGEKRAQLLIAWKNAGRHPAPGRRAARTPARGRAAEAVFPPRGRRGRFGLAAPVRSCGVSVTRASAIGAKAETMSESGLTTPSGPRRFARQRILPTGMEMPSAGRTPRATARTVSKSAASRRGGRPPPSSWRRALL
jgi:hypothetical protein